MSDMSLDDFLGHRTGAARGAFLKNWKGRPEHAVNVWLHKRSPFSCVWRHNLSRVVDLKDGEGTDVWGANWVCWEDEKVLQQQFKRDEDGDRIAPPQSCPICKLLEWIHQSIESGDLSWTVPVFNFEGVNPEHNITYYAGGLTGLFNSKKLSSDQLRGLNKARIYRREAWKQVGWAKANYVFCIVEHERPKDGVQITVEPSLLGDKLKAVIRNALKGKGTQKGDPRVNPYAFEFSFHPDEQEFGKKYDVCLLENDVAPLSEEINRLISGDPPDTSMVTRHFDPDAVRMELEQRACIDIPWDDFFPKSRPKAQQVPAPAADEGGDDDIVCDECGGVVSLEDTQCPHCGHIFKDEEAPPPPPPPAQKRTAPASKVVPPKQVAKPKETSKSASPEGVDEFGGDDGIGGDEIPF
jgi:hypothetical protein